MRVWQCNRRAYHGYPEDKRPKSGQCEKPASLLQEKVTNECMRCGKKDVSYQTKAGQKIHFDLSKKDRCKGIVQIIVSISPPCGGTLSLVDDEIPIVTRKRTRPPLYHASKKSARK